MIVLDTNVLSEPLRPEPAAHVLDWMASLDGAVAITSVTVGELLVGVRRLPAGHRRDHLLAAIERTLDAHAGAVLAYDEPAARHYALLQEARRRTGRPLAVEDGMIAAIYAIHGAALATRNVRDFDQLGVEIIDPWLSPV